MKIFYTFLVIWSVLLVFTSANWTEETKDYFDHNGMVCKWPPPMLLAENGYIDAIIEKYPCRGA